MKSVIGLTRSGCGLCHVNKRNDTSNTYTGCLRKEGVYHGLVSDCIARVILPVPSRSTQTKNSNVVPPSAGTKHRAITRPVLALPAPRSHTQAKSSNDGPILTTSAVTAENHYHPLIRQRR